MQNRTILVTGSKGMLAKDVISALDKAFPEHSISAFDHSTLDITKLADVRNAVESLRPWAVINCAAYTNVDRAEVEIEAAMAVNSLGPRNLAIACEEVGTRLFHVSTDYVFNGEKIRPYEIWDAPNPLSVYGKSKLWGERYIANLCSRHYIARTSWLFGHGGRNFVETITALAGKQNTLRVVSDQKGSPTFTGDLARACVSLLESGAYGIYHVTNSGLTTWHGFATEIINLQGLANEVLPVSTEEFPRPAKRPHNSALDPYPLKEAVGYLLPDWHDALDRYLGGRAQQPGPSTAG